MLTQLKRHLVHDETESFYPARCKEIVCRVRVWRGTDGEDEGPAVVLVGQLPSECDLVTLPSYKAIRVRVPAANWVYQALLGYLPAGLIYFEHDAARNGITPLPRMVAFGRFGHPRRSRLYSPVEVPSPGGHIESLVGEPVSF